VTDRRLEDRCHLCRAGYVDAFDLGTAITGRVPL